jgi:glycosyltransferase involved in cell wall biosynthesis
MFNSPFNDINKVIIRQEPLDADVIFVADAFADSYQGGAELSTEALAESKPDNISLGRFLSSQITLELLEKHQDKFWVFFNVAGLDFNLLPTIIANLQYAVVEYDYKFCKWRSIQKHKHVEGKECDCEKSDHGKLFSAFLLGAKKIFWMSEAQQEIYNKRFPFLEKVDSTVLSSVFNEDFFVKVNELRLQNTVKNDTWLILASPSWIKGHEKAISYCKENNLQYEEIWGLSYSNMLDKLNESRGLIFLPEGDDTCPRIVIEAKLLGCELVLNERVQHQSEEWFTSNDVLETESYLYAARDVFWSSINYHMNYEPTISGYTTTYNCIKSNYPWRACIDSLLGFCQEVVVVDGGSSDGTWEELEKWALSESRLKIEQVKRDWTTKRFATFDGLQKAEARKRCTMEFCWQQDADEVLPKADFEKVRKLCINWPKMTDLIALPVVDLWADKIRMDVTPWKWRLSKNKGYITHGIPAPLRRLDENGEVFASVGTDGCDYIHAENHSIVPFLNFYVEQANNARIAALMGNKDAKAQYELWFQTIIHTLPTPIHYSWQDIERKITTYKNYWQKHWESLYDIKQEDTAENNMFFDKPWSEVTEEEIKELAAKLSEDSAGHVFHSKIDWNNMAPALNIDLTGKL